jgi:hypothetical protein
MIIIATVIRIFVLKLIGTVFVHKYISLKLTDTRYDSISFPVGMEFQEHKSLDHVSVHK